MYDDGEVGQEHILQNGVLEWTTLEGKGTLAGDNVGLKMGVKGWSGQGNVWVGLFRHVAGYVGTRA